MAKINLMFSGNHERCVMISHRRLGVNMRVITANLNGIRSAAKAGFFDWLHSQAADVVCLQETRAQREHHELPPFRPDGYHHYFVDAEKKGYSGVAIYSKVKPREVVTCFDYPLAASEGRYIRADYQNISVISVYLPSGTSGEHRQEKKYEFMDRFLAHLLALRKTGREYIICGDWNIAHTKEDIKNWRGNVKNSGFLPEERAWLDNLFYNEGFIDAFRLLNQESDQYTWWSNRGKAYEKNVGWRIDYQVITPGLKACTRQVAIYKERKFSDHAPLIVDYDCSL